MEPAAKKGFKYMFGDELTLADLSLACELAQLKVINMDYGKIGAPLTAKFYERVVSIP